MNLLEGHAFWVTEPGKGEIRPEALSPSTYQDVVVRALYSGISRGTEALVFQGRVPVSEYQRMRAPFQSGDFPGPVKYGYANVGVVEEGAPELLGRHVFVLYPHQTRYVVPANIPYVLPDDVPSARAVLAANLETAVNGLWDGPPHIGDRIAVIGGGTVGCLTAWLAARVPGCEVKLVDVNPKRELIARALGVPFATPETMTPDCDLVIHASGTADGLSLALRVAGFEATILDLSWYGSEAVPLNLGEAFHARRLTLKSSQVGSVAASQRARWNTRRRMELAIALLRDPALNVLITGESDFETLPDIMPRLATDASETLCHRIRYR